MADKKQNKMMLLLCVVGVSFVSCDVFTSMARIKDMVINELQILNKIKSAVPELISPEHRDLYNFYKRRIEEIQGRNLTQELERLNHPNGAYYIIQEYAMSYQPLRQAVIASGKPNALTAMAEIADDEDVSGAQASLLRLQEVFTLNPEDMIKGNYLKYKGPALNSTDCYFVGKRAFEIGKYHMGEKWLTIALELKKKERKPDPNVQVPTNFGQVGGEAPKDDPAPEAWIRGLLGRTLLRVGEIERARELYRTLTPADHAFGDVYSFGQELQNVPRVESDNTSKDLKDFYRLCSLQSKTVGKFAGDPRLKCRYVSVYLPYFRFNEEIVSNLPYVSLFYEVISNREADAIKQEAISKMFRGGIVGSSGHLISAVRTSHIAFIEDRESKVAKFISKRINLLTKLETKINDKGFHGDHQSAAEPLQVVNYGLGGHYSIHMDHYESRTTDTSRILDYSGNRMATFLIYLTDVERGGSTAFPRADLVVSPVKRSAVFWYTFKPDGSVDDLTLHAGCPVLVGEKWIINKWVLTKGNSFTRRCGLKKNATQLDIDPEMRRGYKPKRKKKMAR
ncbi:prolyl 4-hydroxylase subunit alpha-2-like [Physella acuta]|uniref:prolyl 4-hydroxylase subunit alpha-2-like n=1 Tax=Physella acuta TaxID=109671 RepID=UPI0027DCBFE3|nr:prolyl 4-hydroxylase subunit alpha-2-like [Physella acuta]